MKNLAELKRLKVGDTLTMTFHCMGSVSLVGIPRKIKRVQTNAIQFEPPAPDKDGSWLYFPKAHDFRGEVDGFTILEDGAPRMTYQLMQ